MTETWCSKWHCSCYQNEIYLLSADGTETSFSSYSDEELKNIAMVTIVVFNYVSVYQSCNVPRK